MNLRNRSGYQNEILMIFLFYGFLFAISAPLCFKFAGKFGWSKPQTLGVALAVPYIVLILIMLAMRIYDVIDGIEQPKVEGMDKHDLKNLLVFQCRKCGAKKEIIGQSGQLGWLWFAVMLIPAIFVGKFVFDVVPGTDTTRVGLSIPMMAALLFAWAGTWVLEKVFLRLEVRSYTRRPCQHCQSTDWVNSPDCPGQS